VETFEYQHSEDGDDEQQLVERRGRVSMHKAQPLKPDGGGDDDDEEDGQQDHLGAEVHEAQRILVVQRVAEGEVAADGDQRHRCDEQTNKQAFVRLNLRQQQKLTRWKVL